VYLIGEIHYNHASHTNTVDGLTNRPPNNTIGMIAAGASDVAAVRFGANVLIERPKAEPVYTHSSSAK